MNTNKSKNRTKVGGYLHRFVMWLCRAVSPNTKTKYASGGLIEPGQWDQEAFESETIKHMLKDKPPGHIIHSPFRSEWIMKKPKNQNT